jgi:putative PIG3 family NAD(P)H quinone oxidoreductase
MPTAVPETMTAIEIAAPGGPDALRMTRRATPKPGPGEVLVKVAAAGVNRPDVVQRQGHYPPPPGITDIPGLEIAGEVVALGEAPDGIKLGDKVCALLAGGGYAEYAVAPAPQCLPYPKGTTTLEAAAIPETTFTVWDNLFTRGRLAKGETVLVHGGTSGIGSTAIQLAAGIGARVFATAGSREKCDACKAFGAAAAFDYKQQDFLAEVLRETNGRGVDVILDIVGGAYFAKNLDALATEGRLVIVATLQGAKAELPIFKMMTKRATIAGSTLRARTVAEKGAIAKVLREKAWPLIEAGAKPRIHATFPLAQAAEAHKLMESSAHIGKIVLTLENHRS